MYIASSCFGVDKETFSNQLVDPFVFENGRYFLVYSRAGGNTKSYNLSTMVGPVRPWGCHFSRPKHEDCWVPALQPCHPSAVGENEVCGQVLGHSITEIYRMWMDVVYIFFVEEDK